MAYHNLELVGASVTRGMRSGWEEIIWSNEVMSPGLVSKVSRSTRLDDSLCYVKYRPCRGSVSIASIELGVSYKP